MVLSQFSRVKEMLSRFNCRVSEENTHILKKVLIALPEGKIKTKFVTNIFQTIRIFAEQA